MSQFKIQYQPILTEAGESTDYAENGDQPKRTLRSLTFSGTHKLALLKNLTPRTWYSVEIAATNSAGETQMSYKLATTLVTGGKGQRYIFRD